LYNIAKINQAIDAKIKQAIYSHSNKKQCPAKSSIPRPIL